MAVQGGSRRATRRILNPRNLDRVARHLEVIEPGFFDGNQHVSGSDLRIFEYLADILNGTARDTRSREDV